MLGIFIFSFYSTRDYRRIEFRAGGFEGGLGRDLAVIGRDWAARSFGRFARPGQGAKPAGSEVDAVDERQAVRRNRRRIGLEGGHQAGRNAKADEAAPDHQGRQVAGNGEQAGAGGGKEQENHFDPPWTIAIKEHAERQLEGGEGEEINGGEKPKIAGIESHLAGERRPGDGIDDAKQVAQEIAEGEGQKNAKWYQFSRCLRVSF